MFRPEVFFARQRWLTASNTDATEAPAFGVAEIHDTYADGTLKIRRPTADTIARQKLAIVGPAAIPAGGVGQVTQDFPAVAKLASSADTAHGTQVGTENGSWLLASTHGGFRSWGQVTDQADYALVVPGRKVTGIGFGSSECSVPELLQWSVIDASSTATTPATCPTPAAWATLAGATGDFTYQGLDFTATANGQHYWEATLPSLLCNDGNTRALTMKLVLGNQWTYYGASCLDPDILNGFAATLIVSPCSVGCGHFPSDFVGYPYTNTEPLDASLEFSYSAGNYEGTIQVTEKT